MSDQFVEGKFSGGQKFYWQADTANVDFLLAIGSAYIEGGYGPDTAPRPEDDGEDHLGQN